MWRWILFGLVSLLSGLGALCYRSTVTKPEEAVFEPAQTLPELAPMCPWRDPEHDLPILFPGASRFDLETRILSGFRPEMTLRLGRTPRPDENAVQVYRVYEGDEAAGEVIVRRVKGTFGAIEVVVAANNTGELKGVQIQRSRESQAVTEALRALDWIRLAGKTVDARKTTNLLTGLPPEARVSAQAMIEGVRDAMALLSLSTQTPHRNVAQSHHY